ncbi:hypothetical protein HDU93_008273, partial [Gonapodya sp. JEL0774]
MTQRTVNTNIAHEPNIPRPAEPTPPGIPWSELTVGIPKESTPTERRTAITPDNTALLLKKGFKRVLIERGAGAEADFTDEAYTKAGATITAGDEVWGSSSILLKVRAPTPPEVSLMAPGQVYIGFLWPGQNKELVAKMGERGVTAFAMDQVPRISKAQVFDALSSMANASGYKAVLEAASQYGRFLTGQITAAGKIPPSKVLVIGAGIAGQSAIVTARRLGAIVRAFDTRPAARDEVLSLGAEFLTVEIEEDGAGAGGYAK